MLLTCSARSALPARPSGTAVHAHHSVSKGLSAIAPPLQQQRRQRAVAARAAPEEDLDQLQQDLERLRQRQAAAGGAPAAAPVAARQQPSQAASPASGQQGGGPLAGVKDAVDKLLIADFFFILFALAWLGAALAERSALSSTNLLDAWLGLWQWVFQPAIGVLMLGALVSGAVGWAKDNLGQGQR